MGDAVLKLVPSAHQRRARRRASRADMELREQESLLFESIHRRGAHDGIAQTGIISVTNIVRHDEDDVGLLAECRLNQARAGEKTSNAKADEVGECHHCYVFERAAALELGR